MGLADAFGKEDRVEIKISELFEILKEGARPGRMHWRDHGTDKT